MTVNHDPKFVYKTGVFTPGKTAALGVVGAGAAGALTVGALTLLHVSVFASLGHIAAYSALGAGGALAVGVIIALVILAKKHGKAKKEFEEIIHGNKSAIMTQWNELKQGTQGTDYKADFNREEKTITITLKEKDQDQN